MQQIAEAKPGVIEVFLFGLWQKIEEYVIKHGKQSSGMFILVFSEIIFIKSEFVCPGSYAERPYYHTRSDVGTDIESRTGESIASRPQVQ